MCHYWLEDERCHTKKAWEEPLGLKGPSPGTQPVRKQKLSPMIIRRHVLLITSELWKELQILNENSSWRLDFSLVRYSAGYAGAPCPHIWPIETERWYIVVLRCWVCVNLFAATENNRCTLTHILVALCWQLLEPAWLCSMCLHILEPTLKKLLYLGHSCDRGKRASKVDRNPHCLLKHVVFILSAHTPVVKAGHMARPKSNGTGCIVL